MGARAHLEPLDDGVFLAGFGKSSGYHDYGFCCWRGVDAESHIYAACGTSLKIRCTTSVFVCELCEWSQCWMQLHHPCHQRADHTRHSPLLRAVSSPPPAVPHGRHQHCSTFRDPSSDSGGTSHCSPDDRIRREAASAVILTQNNTPQSLLLFLEWFFAFIKTYLQGSIQHTIYYFVLFFFNGVQVWTVKRPSYCRMGSTSPDKQKMCDDPPVDSAAQNHSGYDGVRLWATWAAASRACMWQRANIGKDQTKTDVGDCRIDHGTVGHSNR